jgi:hypothetical protein
LDGNHNNHLASQIKAQLCGEDAQMGMLPKKQPWLRLRKILRFGMVFIINSLKQESR